VAPTPDEVRIRDLSRPATTEWIPPIGAMGGPPAHELYRDLVSHGGLRLFKDRDGSPWVELQDGERRHRFQVPGTALRGALDRFRMRRNLRPVPEGDLDDFARVVSARVSDPDVRLPLVDPNTPEGEAMPENGGGASPEAAEPTEGISEDEVGNSRLERELEAVLAEVRAVRDGPQPPPPRWYLVGPGPTAAPRSLAGPHPVQLPDVSISGGRQTPLNGNPTLPTYLRVLRNLVEGGGWLGTLGELGELTGEEPEVVYDTLLRYHTDLTGNNLVVAPVELEDGWRWLVVDRSRLRSSPPNEPGLRALLPP